jgi:hypothetical protein
VPTPYEVRFPEYLDDYEVETEAKGYLAGVMVITEGRTVDLTVYDQVRLAQEISDDLGSERAYFAMPNLLVVRSVTKAEISRAVERLARGSFRDLLPNLAE